MARTDRRERLKLRAGAIVSVRDSRSGSVQPGRAIVIKRVMGDEGVDNEPALAKRRRADHSNFSRAYGPEYFICELYGDSAQANRIALDAVKERRHDAAAKIAEDATSINEVSASRLYVRGKVKKIPAICKIAMKNYKR